MDRYFFFIVLTSFYCAYAKIKIIDLVVPEFIEYTDGNVSDIVLDCNYDAEQEEDIEVKWYHNSFTNPIYQWIPSSNRRGEALGVYKYHLDLEYSVPDDKNRMLYRALKLTNLTRDLTGNYTCQISSIYNEVRETKQLVLYSPPKSGIEMTLTEETGQVTCTAEEIFPRPELNIFVTRENGEEIDVELEENTKAEETTDEFGFYTVNATLFFDNLTSIEGMGNLNFVCNLTIPGTNYSDTEFVEFDTGNSSAVVYYPALCLSTLLLVLLLVISK